MNIRPETYFNEELSRYQDNRDESSKMSEAIEKRADELFQEALDDPLTLLKMDKDYDIIQDSLGIALTLCTSAVAGHLIHTKSLVKEIDNIWKRLDKACVSKAEQEALNV